MVSDVNIFAQKWSKIGAVEKVFYRLFFFIFSLRLFAPTSQSPMFKLIRFSESLGKTKWKEVVSDLNTFAHKGCKIAAHKKVLFLTNFALLAGFFWYWCYFPHRSRDALSGTGFVLNRNKFVFKVIKFDIIFFLPCFFFTTLNLAYIWHSLCTHFLLAFFWHSCPQVISKIL